MIGLLLNGGALEARRRGGGNTWAGGVTDATLTTPGRESRPRYIGEQGTPAGAVPAPPNFHGHTLDPLLCEEDTMDKPDRTPDGYLIDWGVPGGIAIIDDGGPTYKKRRLSDGQELVFSRSTLLHFGIDKTHFFGEERCAYCGVRGKGINLRGGQECPGCGAPN